MRLALQQSLKYSIKENLTTRVVLIKNDMTFSKASEEEILGAGSEPSEPEGVKTNSKEVKIVNKN